MVRKAGRKSLPADDVMLRAGDGLLVVADGKPRLRKRPNCSGGWNRAGFVKDRSDLDYIRVFVGKANVVGVPLANFRCRRGFRSISCMSGDMTPTSCRRPI